MGIETTEPNSFRIRSIRSFRAVHSSVGLLRGIETTLWEAIGNCIGSTHPIHLLSGLSYLFKSVNVFNVQLFSKKIQKLFLQHEMRNYFHKLSFHFQNRSMIPISLSNTNLSLVNVT